MHEVAIGNSQSAFVRFKSRISPLHNRITFGFVKPIRKNATFEKISLFPLCAIIYPRLAIDSRLAISLGVTGKRDEGV